ncbi:MAG: AsmA-like C-terminal region-containing protein [Pontiella sp.]
MQQIIQRANMAGISVDIERVTLSLRGWRAVNVRYYTKHPDDLEPVFHAKEVLFVRQVKLQGDSDPGWNFDIEAMDVALSPSIEWGISIPPESEFRYVDQANLSLGFFSDRIEMTDGTLSWMGATFHVTGIFLRSTADGKASSVQKRGVAKSHKQQMTVMPTYVSEQQFQVFEDRLKVIQLNGGADLDISFSVDMNDYASSRIDFNFLASDISFRDVGFSHAEIKGHYLYPRLELDEAVLIQDNQSVLLEGDFNLETGSVQGKISNAITSKSLLLLLPQTILDFLVKVELKFDQLPKLQLSFGPARPLDLINNLTGSFSIQDVSYHDFEIDSLQGLVARSNNRLELTKLEGTAIGQEVRSTMVGSCLTGGSATGDVFWDANTHEFGVSATGSMDPNLLMGALSVVPIATNVIGRFKFKDRPPQVSLQLGAQYTDWSSFFINVQGMANEVQLHDALLSSLNISAFYKHGVLKLDPVAVMQGADFLKGVASADFINSIATFDAYGSLHPQGVEEAIYPGFNFFGKKIKTVGNTQIKAEGILDWGSMRATEFTVMLEAERVEIPIAGMDGFSARVTGVGPLISVNEASFDFYDGHGEADFSIWLDPDEYEMPYEMDLRVEDADFRKCLQFLNPKIGSGISGLLSGKVQFRADMAADFFKSANGKGQISVKEGQLTDLPLFNRFSKIMRKVVPGFNVFSITSLSGTFELKNGVINSQDACFYGDIISAKGHGSYSRQKGFNALVQAQVSSENPVSKIIRVITDPFFKLFELKLEGTMANPSWKLEKFHTHTPSSESEAIESN